MSAALSDEEIESILREAVIVRFRNDDLDSLTLKRVRADAAKKLKFPEEFFKTDVRWKDKSKEIVSDEVEKQEAKRDGGKASSQPQAESVESSPVKPAPRKSNNKRKSPPPKQEPRKLRKTAASSDDESELTPADSSALSDAPEEEEEEASLDEDEEEEDSPPKKKAARKKEAPAPVKRQPRNKAASPQPVKSARKKPVPKVPSKSSAKVDAESDDEADEDESKGANTSKLDDAGSESEMSIVLDEPPPKKRSASKKSQSTNSKPSTTKSAAKPVNNAESDELKLLQSHLSKCGIRKLWGKELAPLSSHSAKVSHLKKMLRDAGMTGRFSEQRAKQIRDERELKMDLEDIVERERVWGEDEGEEEDAEGKGRKGKGTGRRKSGGGGALRGGGKGSDADDDEQDEVEDEKVVDDEQEDPEDEQDKPRRKLARGLKELQQFDDDEEED